MHYTISKAIAQFELPSAIKIATSLILILSFQVEQSCGHGWVDNCLPKFDPINNAWHRQLQRRPHYTEKNYQYHSALACTLGDLNLDTPSKIAEITSSANIKTYITLKECRAYIDTLGAHSISSENNRKFYSPRPSEVIKYKAYGFRGFGKPCDFEVENKFHLEMRVSFFDDTKYYRRHNISNQDAQLIDIGKKEVMKEAVRIWQEYSTDPVRSKKICNPRWYLECKKDTSTCGCFDKAVYSDVTEPLKNVRDHFNITFIQRHICNNTAETEDTFGARECRGKDTILSYRCASPPSTWNLTKTEGKNDRSKSRLQFYGKSCQLSMPMYGICSTACEMLSECTTPSHENVPGWRGVQVCCDVSDDNNRSGICGPGTGNKNGTPSRGIGHPISIIFLLVISKRSWS